MLRNLFTHHVRPTGDELSELLTDCIIAFDTNILLNLYRYSRKTRSDFLKLYEHPLIKPRLWLPYQAADEFMRNRENIRLGTIRDAKTLKTSLATAIEGALNKCKQEIEKIERSGGHPYINIKGLKADLSKDLLATLERVSDKYLQGQNEQPHEHDLDNDALFKRIERLLGRRIGKGFPKKALEEIRIEGEARYKLKVPPGYEDVKDKDDPYGDLIIWKELIRYAKDKGKGLIFVTDDEKEDWVLTVNKQKSGPRPELIKEMFDEAGQRFYLYNSTAFYKHAKELIKETPRPESVQEAEAVNEQLSAKAEEDAWYRQGFGGNIASMAYTQDLLKAAQGIESPLDEFKRQQWLIGNTLNPMSTLQAQWDSISKAIIPTANIQAQFESLRDATNPLASTQAYFESLQDAMSPIAGAQAKFSQARDALIRDAIVPASGLQSQLDMARNAINPTIGLQNSVWDAVDQVDKPQDDKEEDKEKDEG